MAVLAGKSDQNLAPISSTDGCSDDPELRSVLEGVLDYMSEHQSETRKGTDEDHVTLISGQKLHNPGNDLSFPDLKDDPLQFEDIKSKCPKYDTNVLPVDNDGTSELQDTDFEEVVQLRNMVQTCDKEFGEKLWYNAKNYSPTQIPPQITDDKSLKNPLYSDQAKTTVQERRKKKVSVYRDAKTKTLFVRKKYLGIPRMREIEVLNKLKHRSIPVLYDTYINRDHTILNMEYCGIPLSLYVQEYYNRDSYVPEGCVSDILEQLLDVQRYLQLAKVQHQNISAETICIQMCSRKGLTMKLVGFGKVLTYQDSTAGTPEPASKPLCHADMLACGRVVIFMTYGPLFYIENSKIISCGDELINHLPKLRNDFPKTYSDGLKELVLRLVIDPSTCLDEIHKKRQQELIELSDSDEEVLQLPTGVERSCPPSAGIDSGHPPSAGIDSGNPSSAGIDSDHPPSADIDSGHPSSAGIDTSYLTSTDVDSSHQPSIGVDSGCPPMSVSLKHQAPFQQGKNITFLKNGNSKDLPIITPPSDREGESVHSHPGFAQLQFENPSQSLSGNGGTVGFSSNRPDNVMLVNPTGSWYEETNKAEVVSLRGKKAPLKEKQQANTVTLDKLKLRLGWNKGTREKPYTRPQTEFSNLPHFEKIEK